MSKAKQSPTPKPLWKEDKVKEIILTRGRVAIVDDEDFERLNQHKWYADKSTNTYYAVRNISIDGEQTKISMHREVMNAKKGIQVDHKNGDGIDNRKENLRLCNSQENKFNKKHPHKNNKLGIKGVFWHKKNKRFIARIGIDGKKILLGCFINLDDADIAYRQAEVKYFGEFARGKE